MDGITTRKSRRGSKLVRSMAFAWLGGAGLLASLSVTGCSVLPQPVEDPTRYYLLSSATASTTQTPTASQQNGVRVGVRSVELAPYLRGTRTIVVRNGANEIRYQDYARWAEPLDLAVQRAIRERLESSENVSAAEVAPFAPEARRDYDVSVRLLQCEGGAGGNGKSGVQFSASYEIADVRNQGQIVARKTFIAPQTDWNGSDFAALAAKLGDDAQALGNDIAATLKVLADKR